MHSANVLKLNVRKQEGWSLYNTLLKPTFLCNAALLKGTQRHFLFVNVKASNYTILIASDMRNVPNVLKKAL